MGDPDALPTRGSRIQDDLNRFTFCQKRDISPEGTNGYFQTSWYLGGSFIDHLQMFLDRSPIFHVKNVRTPVLIQGGLLDDNVPHTQLEEFYRALKRAGADAHLVGYPGSTHDFYPPKLYLRLLRSCLDWTEQHRNAAR